MNEQPAYKVGDEVRIVDRDDALLGAVGMVIAVWNTKRSCKVQFDTGEDEWFRPDQLKHVGPLGVEPWRLLFRAHRDGWRLFNDFRYHVAGVRTRQYCQEGTGLTFGVETPCGAK